MYYALALGGDFTLRINSRISDCVSNLLNSNLLTNKHEKINKTHIRKFCNGLPPRCHLFGLFLLALVTIYITVQHQWKF